VYKLRAELSVKHFASFAYCQELASKFYTSFTTSPYLYVFIFCFVSCCTILCVKRSSTFLKSSTSSCEKEKLLQQSNMPRRKGKSTTVTPPTKTAASTVPSPSPVNNKRTPVNDEASVLDQLFSTYREQPQPDASPEDHIIGPDGLERLCNEMGIDPQSRLLLIFAQQCECQELGTCRKDELTKGLKKLGWTSQDAFSLKKVGTKLKGLDRTVATSGRTSPQFQDLYKFTFDLCKQNKQSKVVDKLVASGMLPVVMGEDAPHVKSFVTFLEESAECKVLNYDQWQCFLQFSNTVDEALSRYSDEDSWPSLLDEFVEYKRKAEAKRI